MQSLPTPNTAHIVNAEVASRMLAPGDDIAQLTKLVAQYGAGAHVVSLAFGVLDCEDPNAGPRVGYVLEVAGTNRNLASRLQRRLDATRLREHPIQVIAAQTQSTPAVATAAPRPLAAPRSLGFLSMLWSLAFPRTNAPIRH
jgi:hypothetical protein